MELFSEEGRGAKRGSSPAILARISQVELESEINEILFDALNHLTSVKRESEES
jgi:hypothetical protein